MNTLDKLLLLDEVASQAPWYYYRYRDEANTADTRRRADIVGDGDTIIHRDHGMYGPEAADAELIIAMRNALPHLLKLAKQVDELVESAVSETELVDQFTPTKVSVNPTKFGKVIEALHNLTTSTTGDSE
jgi:hypothetical protein